MSLYLLMNQYIINTVSKYALFIILLGYLVNNIKVIMFHDKSNLKNKFSKQLPNWVFL